MHPGQRLQPLLVPPRTPSKPQPRGPAALYSPSVPCTYVPVCSRSMLFSWNWATTLQASSLPCRQQGGRQAQAQPMASVLPHGRPKH